MAGRLSPRVAGVLALVGAVLLALTGGALLAIPPWSVPAALLLVAASILFSIGTVWLHRRSWSEPWPPDVTSSTKVRMRRVRALLLLEGVLVVGALAFAIYAIVSRDWWRLGYSVFLMLMGLSNLALNRRTLRALQGQQSGEQA